MSNYLDSIYTALNNLVTISADYIYSYDLKVINSTIMNTAVVNTLTVLTTLNYPLNYVWTNLINQAPTLVGTNQLAKTNFNNNVTQSAGSSQLLDTSIGSVTQSGSSVIVQSGNQWNQLKQTQVTDLSITGVLTLPSNIVVSGSTYNSDLVLNNATVQQTITGGGINTLGATDFYNGDVRMNQNLTMIGGAGTTATLKNLVVQGTSTLGLITGTTISDLYNTKLNKSNDTVTNITFAGTVTGLSKSNVALGNCDNTSDLLKPLSTASINALALKSNTANPQFTGMSYFNNSGSTSMTGFGSGYFGGIATNLQSGHAEMDFINTGFNSTNLTLYAFNWYLYTSSTSKTLLMSLYNSGNVNFLGNITSPTITTINSNIALKADKTYVDSTFGTITNLNLKADKTYVDSTFGTITNLNLKADKTYVDSTFGTITNLNLKADKTYVDSTFGTITNLNLKADKTYVDSTFGTITNLNLKADKTYVDSTFGTITNLNLKADSANPSVTGTLTFDAVAGQKIKLYANSNNFNSSAISIESTAVRYNTGATASHTFSVSNAGATAYTNVMSASSTGLTVNLATSLQAMSATTGTFSSDITGPTITNINSNLALLAPINNPTFTGTVLGITKAMVGLSNVDNTSDVNKPVSTATNTALNLKSNIANPQFTGITYFTNSGTNSMTGFGSSYFGGIATNLQSGHAEMDFINTGFNSTNLTLYAFNWYIYTSSTTKTLLMSLYNSGNVNFLGTITSPTITTINSNIALKSNTNNPTFTGTVTSPSIITNSVTSQTSNDLTIASSSGQNIAINASNYMTMQGGQVYIDNAGNVLARSISDNTATTVINSTGLTANNITCNTSLKIPVQPSRGIYCRAFCTISCSNGVYSMVHNGAFVSDPNTGIAVSKIATGQIILLVGVASGINTTNFMIQCQGMLDSSATANATLMVQCSNKGSYAYLGATHSYGPTLGITTKGITGGSFTDLTNTGYLDVMIYW